MRVKKDDELNCANCGAEFPETIECCDRCFCPHKSLGDGEDAFLYDSKLWPDIVAVLVDGLKNTVPLLTLQDLADANPKLKPIFEAVGDKYKAIKVY